MSFRFRRSVSIAPGVRINFGKTGASVSAGVRGARVTFGRSGTRATGGIPGTGVSYTRKVSGKKPRGAAFLLLIILLLIIGVLTKLSSQSSFSFGEFAPIIVVLGVFAAATLVVVLVRRVAPPNEGTESTLNVQTSSAQCSDSGLASAQMAGIEPEIPPQRSASLKAIMREAAANKRRRGEEENRARREFRLAETLSGHKCFYMHNGEKVGPVTLWQVREMVEADLFDPDVQVILEGSDYWYSYAEQELRVAPPPNSNTAALHAAEKLQCHYLEGGDVRGPLSLLVILHKIRLGELPKDVQIRAEGSQEWRRASDV